MSSAEQLVSLLAGAADARQQAYTELESADNAVASSTAVVEALVDQVICSPTVEADEYRQVWALIGDLMLRQDGTFLLHMVAAERYARAWEAPALLAAAGKPPRS